ncbi:MAG: TSUP family transporter [Planctomycetes bacterium]|nr:TSUP family transporter [Planctomycetota bacterium]
MYALGVVGVVFSGVWLRQLARDWKSAPKETGGFPNIINLATGFVTNFLDTWSIGSFATTTALFRFLKQCPDRLIPGTLNVGHCVPTIVEALLWTTIVKIDPTTLISMIAAAVAGATLGAPVVAGWPKRKIQMGMGLALLAASALLLQKQIDSGLHWEKSIGLDGSKFWIGISINCLLGALMTLGIGLYAPCMILVSSLGMEEASAFPIMMGSCAFLMPVAGVQFIRKSAYSAKAALGLAIGGAPAVALATWLFYKLQDAGAGDQRAQFMYVIRWIVLGVVVYTSITMLYSAFFDKRDNTQK